MPMAHMHAATQSHAPRNTRRAAPHNHTPPKRPLSSSSASTVSTPPRASTVREEAPCSPDLTMSLKAEATTPVPHDSVSPSTPRSKVRMCKVPSSSGATTFTLHPPGAWSAWWRTGKAAPAKSRWASASGQSNHITWCGDPVSKNADVAGSCPAAPNLGVPSTNREMPGVPSVRTSPWCTPSTASMITKPSRPWTSPSLWAQARAARVPLPQNERLPSGLRKSTTRCPCPFMCTSTTPSEPTPRRRSQRC